MIDRYCTATNAYIERTAAGFRVWPLGDDPIDFDSLEELESFCAEEVAEINASLAGQGCAEAF